VELPGKDTPAVAPWVTVLMRAFNQEVVAAALEGLVLPGLAVWAGLGG
jgi:hypothetical protein